MVIYGITLSFGKHWHGFRGPFFTLFPHSLYPSCALLCPSPLAKLDLPSWSLSSTIEHGCDIAHAAMAEVVPTTAQMVCPF